MKKKLFILGLLMFPLISCGGQNDDPGDKPGPDDDTPIEPEPGGDDNPGGEEPVEPEKPDLSFIQEFLDCARLSYTLNADEKELINRASDGALVVENNFKYDISNISGKDARIKETVTAISGGEMSRSSIEYVKDENGYVATEVLDYSNTIIDKKVAGNAIYDVEFANPFSLISIEDFTLENDYYLLNSRKNDIFLKYLLGINYEIDNVKFYFTNEEFEKITISSVDYENTYLDLNINQYIPVNISYETEVTLSNIGTTAIEGKKVLESRNSDKEEALQKAFEQIGTNFTIILNEHDRDYEPNHDYDTVWYFNGEDAVYHQQTMGDTRKSYDLYYKTDEAFPDGKLRYFDYDETTATWNYVEPVYSQSYNSAPKTYEWFLPKFSTVSPLVFDFVEEENKYVVTNTDVLGYIGNAFLPGAYSISYFTNGAGDKCEIELTTDGKIKNITVGYYYEDSQGFPLWRDFDLQFLNIGKTTIPSWVEG